MQGLKDRENPISKNLSIAVLPSFGECLLCLYKYNTYLLNHQIKNHIY